MKFIVNRTLLTLANFQKNHCTTNNSLHRCSNKIFHNKSSIKFLLKTKQSHINTIPLTAVIVQIVSYKQDAFMRHISLWRRYKPSLIKSPHVYFCATCTFSCIYAQFKLCCCCLVGSVVLNANDLQRNRQFFFARYVVVVLFYSNIVDDVCSDESYWNSVE